MRRPKIDKAFRIKIFLLLLLRVLESGEFNRLGVTNRIRKTNVRIISVASTNLPEPIQQRKFFQRIEEPYGRGL